MSLDDGREVQVRSNFHDTKEETSFPCSLPVGGRVALSRHHRWWSGPSAWEFQSEEGFLRRLW